MMMRMYGGTRGHAHFLRSNLIKMFLHFSPPIRCLLWKTFASPAVTAIPPNPPTPLSLEVWKPNGGEGGVIHCDLFEGNGTCRTAGRARSSHKIRDSHVFLITVFPMTGFLGILQFYSTNAGTQVIWG